MTQQLTSFISDARTPSGRNPDGLVLVIDDDRFQCEEIVEYLRDQGIDARFETLPELALQVIPSLRPALVLCDVNMPGLDGVRLVRIVRESDYRGEMILMSGNPDAERRANQSRADVFAVLPKPLPMPALERHVRSVLRRAALGPSARD